MKKNIQLVSFFIAIIVASFSSCKHSDNSIYYYSEARDTIAPTILLSVPLNGDLYGYTEDIHIVGNVSDKETVKSSGKLKSFSMYINQIDPSNNDTILKPNMFTKNLAVDGKDGYTFNEKLTVNSGAGTTFYKLYLTAYDYANRMDKDSILFSIQ